MNAANASDQIAGRHFSRKTLRALARKGVRIIGLCTIPGDGPLPWATGETDYQVDDNGTGRIWSFSKVLREAA